MPEFLLVTKEAQKPCLFRLLVHVFGLVRFRESASQSLALFIIVFSKEKSKELSGYMRYFFLLFVASVVFSVG